RRSPVTSWVFCALLAVGPQTPTSWTPPEKADPSSLLQEAAADRKEGRYELALAKHIWLYENATRYQPRWAVVRLSIALGGWFQLAQAYPPALEALKKARDGSLARLKEDPSAESAFDTFQELEAIDRKLGDEALTVQTFVWLDTEHPAVARRLFNVAIAGL